MYECRIETNVDLVARITIVASSILEITEVFENERRFLSLRCEAYITAVGRLLSNSIENVFELKSSL